MSYDKAFKMSMYRNMLEQRVFEKAVQEQYEEGNIPNSAHLYLGQEAIAAGVSMALRPDDYILPSHRGHAQILAKGCDMNRMMAELFGRVDGYCKGKGGSMHLAVAEHGVLGSIGIVGCNMALAVGAGMAAKKNGTGQVAICYFGDGASNRGTFHEGMNLCSIQKLPVIYALENNHYGMFSDYRDMVNVEKISCRAAGYGVPGETVDGNDPWACYEAAKKAGITNEMTHEEICEAMIAVFTDASFSVDGLTGTGMTWGTNGEVSKAPMVVEIQNGAYVEV